MILIMKYIVRILKKIFRNVQEKVFYIFFKSLTQIFKYGLSLDYELNSDIFLILDCKIAN